MSSSSEIPQELSDATNGKRPLTAEEWKAKGNECFKNNILKGAIFAYDQAIAVEPSAALYSNRATCEFKLENFGTALRDCTSAIELDPNFFKSYYRRGCCYISLHKLDKAVEDFKKLCQLQPQNADARNKLKEASNKLKEEKFMEAIAVKEELASDKILNMIGSFVVPADYAGPRLTFPVTPDQTDVVINDIKKYFFNQKLIPARYAYEILLQTKTILQAEQNIVPMTIPSAGITVVGDIHGQYYDLLTIFSKSGYPGPDNRFVFNGDYVDRGSFGVEVILFLFLLKCLNPQNMIMLRGNHETHYLNMMYGFEGETKKKYNERLYALFKEVFCLLPLCAVLSTPPDAPTPLRVLCVHGGLFSRNGVTFDDITQINRNNQVPQDESLFSEMLWSDPQEVRGWAPSPRGLVKQFGPDVTESFCKGNKIDYILRSHQVFDEGYKKHHDGRMYTVFSAPNYCDSQHNKASFCKVLPGKKEPEFEIFSEVPHPNVPPMQYSSMFM